MSSTSSPERYSPLREYLNDTIESTLFERLHALATNGPQQQEDHDLMRRPELHEWLFANIVPVESSSVARADQPDHDDSVDAQSSHVTQVPAVNVSVNTIVDDALLTATPATPSLVSGLVTMTGSSVPSLNDRPRHVSQLFQLQGGVLITTQLNRGASSQAPSAFEQALAAVVDETQIQTRAEEPAGRQAPEQHLQCPLHSLGCNEHVPDSSLAAHCALHFGHSSPSTKGIPCLYCEDLVPGWVRWMFHTRQHMRQAHQPMNRNDIDMVLLDSWRAAGAISDHEYRELVRSGRLDRNSDHAYMIKHDSRLERRRLEELEARMNAGRS